MARQARSALADSRALEEQNARVSMHGAGRFIGAGGVPSMGLSQFVGGGYDSSSEDECKMCGCRSMCGGAMCGGAAPTGTTYRLGLQRGGPRRYTGPPQTEIVPYVPRAPVGPLTPYRAPPTPRPTPTTVAIRTPGTIKPYSAAEAASRLSATRSARPPARPSARPSARGSYGARVAALLAAGVPLALIGTMLADAAKASGASPTDAGYYDDYVDVGDDGLPPAEPNAPLPRPPPTGPNAPLPPTRPNAPQPSDMAPSEVRFYLQSGNLPDRFYSGPRSRRGGKQQASGRRAERAAIVKKVMAEKGMKLIEASRYVKANNLY